MKLHLPFSLRKALLAVMSAVAVLPVMAGSMSSLVPQAVYCDFGDNAGLYSVHGVNALLTQLRKDEGGIFIYYTEGSGLNPQSVVQYEGQPMISFESRMDSGPGAAVSYNILATVEHNGVLNPTFTSSKIGGNSAIHYAGIEYRKSAAVAQDASFAQMNVFRLVPQTDFKITRLSKIVTDVSTYDFNTDRCSSYTGQMWYRSGSGAMYQVAADGSRQRWGGAYSYCTGGIMQISSSSNYNNYGEIPDYRGVMDTSGSVVVYYDWWRTENIESGRQPLPFCIQSGDSGSPTWIYDQASGTYLYSGAMQSGEGTKFSQARYAGQWAKDTEAFFNVNIKLTDGETVTIGAVDQVTETHYDAINNVTSHPYKGLVTRADGTQTNFIGVNTGLNTWSSLSSIKDTEKWYAYGNDMLNNAVSYADLFETQNLVFNGRSGQSYNVVLDATVDTGIGYTRFVNTEGEGTANFTISGGHQLNTAGFVVERGTELHISLTGEADYAREWRKIGEGDLYIEGSGNNNEILLSLGGSGTTFLKRKNGYAAFNVLANNGTRVVIDDTQQIYRDFTFGYGGATLDMHGCSMEWNNDFSSDKDGFTIHALTDDARITNAKADSVTRLTWTQGEQREYLGSFVDTENGGVLQFEYAGGNGNKLTLHSIYTDLHNVDSSTGKKSCIIVTSGTLALQGTVTQHAPGSLGVAFSSAKLVNKDDWHYADMTTPVTVQNGGTFELDNHARLTGNVTVQDGGAFVMREGVTHQTEYLEGYYTSVNTDKYREFFGLKGDVELQAGAEMRIEFSSNADSTLVYDGAISGSGKLVVDSGIIGGMVVLGGINTGLDGEKVIQHGGMRVTDLKALGNVSADDAKWRLTDSGFLVVDKVFSHADSRPMAHNEVLDYIRADSDGILALTQDTEVQFDLSGHRHLVIGAYLGQTVEYGRAADELRAVAYTAEDGEHKAQGFWHLGGGGGEIQVFSKLVGNNDLLLGANYAKGAVYLKNSGNNFTGSIIFKGGVTLKYDDDSALGNASVLVNYTNRIVLANELEKVYTESDGAVLVDKIDNRDLDLSNYAKLSIGSEKATTYSGHITVADGGTYNFGGSTGVLTLDTALQAYGVNNLNVDGQNFNGGEILLKQRSEITGAVTVRGCNKEQATQTVEDTGDIILGLAVDDALQSAASTTLMRGGYLDLHDTSQQLRDLAVQKGGVVFSSGDSAATLNVQMTRNLRWDGRVAADTVNVSKAGSNSTTLTLAGTADYREMHINSGVSVLLGANNSLAALGATYVESGASLNMNGFSAEGNIVVKNGGILSSTQGGSAVSGYVTLENGKIRFEATGSMSGTSTLVSNGGTVEGNSFSINGLAIFQKDTTSLRGLNGEGGVSFGGTVEIANDAKLKLEDTQFSMPFLGTTIWTHYSISSAEFNITDRRDEDGKEIANTGKLLVETRDLRLGTSNQDFGGIVELTNGRTTSTYISAEKGTKTFDTLAVNTTTAYLAMRNPRLNNTYQASNADWVVHHLNSDAQGGNLEVSLNAGHFMKLDDIGTFGQTLTMKGGTLTLAALDALQNGVAKLDSSAKLAVDTAAAQVRGLQGAAGTTVYAGSERDTVSTRNATLVIKTAGDTCEYNGSVLYNEDAACGVSIVKDGSGTQNFSGGSAVSLRNVTVAGGTLGFTGDTAPVIHGDVAIAQGTTLKMDSLALGQGNTLGVLGTEGSTGSARLEGTLVLAGGGIVFSGAVVDATGRANTAALELTGTASYRDAEALSICFSEEREMASDKSYLLSSGDWHTVADSSITADSMVYYDAVFTTGSDGLRVSFTERSDIQIWDGVTGMSSWDDAAFGQTENKLNETKAAIFNDDAASTNVSVNSDVAVKEMVFDNDEKDYELAAGSNAGVQADSLRQIGTGTTTLMHGVEVGTAAVEAGTLSLEEGSSVQEVSVAESATVVIKDTGALAGTITGEGVVQVDWGNGNEHALNFTSLGTVEVKSGSVDMTEQEPAQMRVLHVMEGASYSNTAQKDNYADKAIVDKDGRLETSIGGHTTSGTVSVLEGEGTVVLTNAGQVDMGDNKASDGSVDASGFTGTLQLGNGAEEFRFRSTNVSGLGAGATIELKEKAQFWAGNGDTAVQADMVLHGDSASSKDNSWKGEGFGAVRGVSNFNGTIAIDGNALVSGAANIAFNGNIMGMGDDDTLTFGGYHGSIPSQTYTLAEGMQTENLANMVVRLSGNRATTVNVNSAKGLADHLEFAEGVADMGVVNVNAANEIGSLTSKAGDGVVNIALGGSLALEEGADFGGGLNMAMGVSIGTKEGAANVAHITEGVKFDMTSAAAAVVSGAGDGATRMENAAIDLAEGSRLVMENITLSTNSTVTDETAAAALAAKSLKLEAKVGENLMRRESVAARMQPLTYGLDMPQPKMAAASADDVVSFTLTNVSGVSLVGDALMINLVGDSATALGGADWLSVSLANGGTFDDALNVTLLYMDAKGAQKLVQGVYSMDDAALAAEAEQPHNHVYFRLSGAAQVPEPTTGALSLLALAALTARRRRK